MPYKDPTAPGNVERMRSYRRKHYHENKQPYIERAKAAKIEMAAWYRSLKHMKPCTDCGVAYPYYVMDWDHTGDDKVMDLRKMATKGYGKASILAEIAKCELVCANCHRIRTWNRSNGHELDL